MRIELISCVLVGASALSGCAPPMETDISSLGQAVRVANGISSNGTTANGVSANGWEYGGEAVNGAALDGSLISLTTKSGKVISGSKLEGTKIPIVLSNGESAKLRIDSVTLDSASGIYLYMVTIQPARSKKQPLCPPIDGAGAPAPAIPLAGRYDATSGAYSPDDGSFTFACTNAALGKCVLWGYKPWASKDECSADGTCNVQSLNPWHQACVRMVRADYCGDGVTHTRNGTQINIWDNLGIQQPSPNTGWALEAEWTPFGAACINHTRWLKADPASAKTDLAYIQETCPERLAVNTPAQCGLSTSSFSIANGFGVDPMARHLLRNESTVNQ